MKSFYNLARAISRCEYYRRDWNKSHEKTYKYTAAVCKLLSLVKARDIAFVEGPANISEVLTLVRDTALKGRKLEAWSETCYSVYSYNIARNRFHRRSKDHGGMWYAIEDAQIEFTINELMGTWYVREVKE
jgi:hypothetical protein